MRGADRPRRTEERPWRGVKAGLLAALLAPAFLAPDAARALAIDWVYVGAPGNAADDDANCASAGCGSVAYAYYISKYEVTNAQYAEFLNATAADDASALVPPHLARGGDPGSYAYSVQAGYEQKPVGVWWDQALHFANWLSNGGGSGDTETGAYTMLPGGPDANAAVTRNAGGLVFLASESEWYKAAYYDAALGSYYDYAGGSDIAPTCATPTTAANAAACEAATIEPGLVLGKVDVGSYPGSPSPMGTFDQGGNAAEWNDTLVASVYGRGLRGGHWGSSLDELSALDSGSSLGTNAARFLGFRVVATVVPEPGTGLLVLAGLAGLARRRRR